MRQGDAHTVSITLVFIEISNIHTAVSLRIVYRSIQLTMTTGCVRPIKSNEY